MLRAELRVSHFAEANSTISRRDKGSVVVAARNGVLLLSIPVAEQYLGQPSPGVLQFMARQEKGSRGNLEFTPVRDGSPRFYSWRYMKQHPLLVAVGLGKDDVLKSWRERAWNRATLVAGGCLVLLALSLALIVYQRRLAASRSQLRATELRYTSAMENSTIGIAISDVQGQWTHANPALCAMLGYALDELVAIPTETLTAEPDRGVRLERLKAFSRGALDTFGREKRLLRKGGGEIWVHMQATVLREDNGQANGLIVHVQDITQRKQADQAIRELNEDLEHRVAQRTLELSRANQDLEAFSYSAAHDLKGPLERLVSFVDVLGRELGDLPEKTARRMDSIRRQGVQMTALINGLLDLSHSTRAQLRQEPVAMDEVVAQAREQLEVAAGRNVQWVVAPLPRVLADPGLLREALVNLLGNALKYSRGRDPAVIEIGMGEGGHAGEAVFFVRDNGAGFDMAYAEGLFTAFRRLHSVSEFEGTGIGLAIVLRIIERNGGRIWAHSEPGQGATFSFTLPLADPPP